MFAFGLRVTLAKGGRGPNKSGVVRTFFEKKKSGESLLGTQEYVLLFLPYLRLPAHVS